MLVCLMQCTCGNVDRVDVAASIKYCVSLAAMHCILLTIHAVQAMGIDSGSADSGLWLAAKLQICPPAEHHCVGGHQLQLPLLFGHCC